MSNEWFNDFATKEMDFSAENIIIVILIMLGAAAICLAMFVGLRKCVKYGQEIGHRVISPNIILFAIPMLIFVGFALYSGINEVPWIVWIIITIVCWGAGIVINIIFCKGKVLYTLGYIFFQFLIAFLLSSVLISIVMIFVLAIFLIVGFYNGHASMYNIVLVPLDRDYSRKIRARRNPNDTGLLDGEHGEQFSHISGNKYMLMYNSIDSSDGEIYQIY